MKKNNLWHKLRQRFRRRKVAKRKRLSPLRMISKHLKKHKQQDQEWTERYGGTKNWQLLREAILKRDGYKCVICKTDKQLRVHHLIPLSKGGKNEPQNLITVCSNCHKYLHPNNPNIW